MALDAWLPIGFTLPDGAKVRMTQCSGADWQILETQDTGRALVVGSELERRWRDAGLISEGTFGSFHFGARQLCSLACGPGQLLGPVNKVQSPNSKAEALSFAMALKATRAIDRASSLHDSIYVEKITRLLPVYSSSSGGEDEVMLGNWLTGGVDIPATSFRGLHKVMGWMDPAHLRDVVQAAGFEIAEQPPDDRDSPGSLAQTGPLPNPDAKGRAQRTPPDSTTAFELAGRPELAAFFNEHVIDIVRHPDRYKALGIGFPSAVILHGPPGCGKTFAVERLVDFLDWPSFQIDASSVASSYIHETSKKVAEVFQKAMDNAPSVLVIDEMEAFLADREMGSSSSHHRVEEMAEFLRRIPEAAKNQVLIIAMTNRIEMIDPAIQRRGRFDHIVHVGFADEIEVQSLLDTMLASLPREADVESAPLAQELAGRPLSDVAFVVREGARLAARAGKERLDQASLLSALATAPAREREGGASQRKMGFL